MSNMSYCRFQNTYSDLQDCYYSLQEEDKLSADEESAKKRLIKLCSKIVAEFGDEPKEEEIE